MLRSMHSFALPVLVALVASFLLPEVADARSSQRRNYADEWRQEEREERFREEREKSRQERLEHDAERQKRYLDATAESQDKYHHHQKRQLDSVLDHYEGRDRYRPRAAPAAPAATGTCMYGPNDKVIYQPKGVTCER